MDNSRRRFLWNAGKVVLVAAGAVYGLRSCDALPDSAAEAWQGPEEDEADIRRWVLAYAILAPSAQNMQPWKVDLRGAEDLIRLHLDAERLLSASDPFANQALLGLGGFIESLVIAASHKHYRADIQYFPEGTLDLSQPGKLPLADIRLVRDSSVIADPLFDYLLQRRSNRQFYQSKPLSTEHRDALQAEMDKGHVQLDFISRKQEVEAVRLLAAKAIGVTMTTPETMQETITNTRIGANSIDEARDGNALHGPLIWWLQKAGRLSEDSASVPGSMGYNTIFGDATAPLLATPGFVLFQSAGHSPLGQLEIGRAYLRFNLLATRLGVSVQPMNQLLADFQAMAETQAELYHVLNKSPFRAGHLLVRIGYGFQDVPAPTARRPLETILLTDEDAPAQQAAQ